MRCLACAILTVAFLPAAGSSIALAGGGSNTKTDPCALVTGAEVAEALGEQPGPGENDGIGDCEYRGESGYASTVTISVDENAGRRDWFLSQKTRDNVAPVADVGEDAFVFVSSAGFVQITALKGETLVTVMVAGGSHPDRVAATTDLARRAAERLGTAAAMARIPGLEALAGRWYGDAGGSAWGTRDMRSWVIEADGNWTMTMAPEHAGFLTAQDGQWRMDSPREGFAGTYEIAGADRLSTSGDVAADWTRVPDGEEPPGVDPDFLGIWTQIPLGGMAHGPLDPAVIGLWRATLDGPERPSVLVWRIGAAGYSVLTEIITVSGDLSAENGEMKFIPADGEPIALTYQFQGRDAFVTTDDTGTIRWQRRGTGLVPQ